MARNGGFEDLLAWQKARLLTQEVYAMTRRQTFARDYSLADQLRRAAVSIMSNVAEGFERQRRAEFHQFLVIAKGSCGEVRSQLYVALDAGYIDQATFRQVHSMAHELSRVLGGLRTMVRKQEDPKS